MNPYAAFVAGLGRLLREAKATPLGGLPAPAHPAPPPDAPCALIFSPHPDDEVIIGGLPLRLRRESRWRVLNVAVTQGSNKARQGPRWQELQACCDYVGFGLVQTAPGGLENITLAGRAARPDDWARSVARIAGILREHRPRAIFLPHDDDWNTAHIGTHHLVVEALGSLGPEFACLAVETEFWGAMRTPNLMVELGEGDVTDLITALSFHVGEVQRNPYHVRLPAWFIDNVRRGGELVGGQGGAAPDFQYATLYRVREWRGGQFQPCAGNPRFVPAGAPPGGVFA
ncbi:MAG: hypothetical protein RJA22_2840 [Verrucomicrobiota bacterium]|jgi:LmbE family N-acetylglucosaminyl deacetylase